jgi:hypothetical protein
MSRQPTYTVAMRDWSVPLGEWIWTCVDGTPPPRPALEWRELVVVGPGVKVWRSINQEGT